MLCYKNKKGAFRYQTGVPEFSIIDMLFGLGVVKYNEF